MNDEQFRRLDEREKLAEIHRLLRTLVTGERIIMANQAEQQAAIDASVADISAINDGIKSATALIGGFSQRVLDAIAAFQAANPGVNTQALTDAVALEKANAAALAAAVVANTPAAPPAPAP